MGRNLLTPARSAGPADTLVPDSDTSGGGTKQIAGACIPFDQGSSWRDSLFLWAGTNLKPPKGSP